MFNSFRYDYILIWGNGLIYKNQIIKEIKDHLDFEIISIINHKPKTIKNLVKAVYSFDYAPFAHLRNKTRYLLSTKPEVCFIFFKNNNPDEDYLGKNKFRHVESLTLKKFKEKIRDRFNERKEDRRSENHVIHASDNQQQTDYILKYLGYSDGIKYLERKPNGIIKCPNHLKSFDIITIKEIDINKIFCSIINFENNKAKLVQKPLSESPHYKAVSENKSYYVKYLQEFQGDLLKDNYSEEKFYNLLKNLKYLEGKNKTSYIIVKEEKPDFYVILDGLHRASILKYRGENKIIAGVVS